MRAFPLSAAARGAVVAIAALLADLAVAESRAPAHDLCADPVAACGARLSPGCLSRVGAASVAAQTDHAACRAEQAAYVDCLAEVSRKCGPAPAPRGAICDQQTASAAWRSVELSDAPSELRAFAAACPDSPFAAIAKARAARLERSRTAPAARSAAEPPAAAAVAANKRKAALLQEELKRLGCYRGGVDGIWGAGSRAAMDRFNRNADADHPRATPSDAALAAAKAAPSGLCPASAEKPPAPHTAAAPPAGADIPEFSGRVRPDAPRDCRREPLEACRIRHCPDGTCPPGVRGSGVCFPENREVICQDRLWRPRTTPVRLGPNCRYETKPECLRRVCPSGYGCRTQGTGLCAPVNREAVCP